MGRITDNSAETGKNVSRRKCRVAYSLNNMQPVQCTIISDQPLFYYDHEEIFDEDDILMDEEFLALDKDIQALKKKIETYDRFSLEFTQPADARVQLFLADSALIGDKAVPNTDKIDDFLDIVRKSRMAQALLGCAEDHNVVVRYSTQVQDGLYDKASYQILINPNLPLADRLLITARELRRHWQHRQGVIINPLAFQPDQAILVNRAQIADLSVFMVRVAWELQLSDEKAAWERVENSSLSDLGRTFAREAYVDFRTLNNGHASSAVFETWFLSERCHTADKIIIQKMLADYEGLVFNMDQVSQNLTTEFITTLGEMPYGKNYLAPYTQLVMNDPIFTDVRDRSNANFLWFIKFEQSFRETEQEIEDEKLAQATFDTEIINLPNGGQSAHGAGGKLEAAAGETNVVYVQFCSS